MGRDNNTFEKMQRERLRKQKADDKRARRQKRKEEAAAPTDAGIVHDPPNEEVFER